MERVTRDMYGCRRRPEARGWTPGDDPPDPPRCRPQGMAHLEPASEDFESEGAEGIGGLGDVPFYGATSEAQLGDSPGSSQRPELVVKDRARARMRSDFSSLGQAKA